MIKTLLVPKTFLAWTLFLLFSSSIFVRDLQTLIISLVLALGTALVTDLLILQVKKTPFFLPTASAITGLIVALLVDPNNYLLIVLSAFLAVLSKHIIKFNDHHIFNPAAFGILTSSIIFRESVSWWGISWGTIPLVITALLVGYLVLFRMRRYLIPLSFLTIYFVTLKFSTLNFQLSTFVDPTIFFFALVMLPEPMTSPNDHKSQIFYGIIVAILASIISIPTLNSQFSTLNFFDPLLFSLLLGNLIFKLL